MSRTETQLEQRGVPLESFELTQRPWEVTAAEGPTPADRRNCRVTYLKIISAGFSFFVAGVSDGSIGPLVPYIIRDYDVDTAIVSSVYGASFLGWLLAAVSNTHLSHTLDLGSMLFLGAALQVVAQALRAWKPPFGLFVVTFLLVCVGQGYQDTHGNTFVASTRSAHRGLAFIHAMYMAGCLCGPFVSTAVASVDSPSQWYLFYLFPLGLGVINMCLVLYAFWDSLGLRRKARVGPGSIPGNVSDTPEQQLPDTQDVADNNSALVLMRETLANRNVWLLSLFFFFFLGAALTASGWIVEYLVVVRDGDLSRMGYVPAGFSGGSLLGRLLLAEPTHRFGERRVIGILTIISLAMQIIFWLVPNIIAASIAVSLLGFSMGPFFATGISIGSKLFAPDIQPTALAFLFVFAQMGGCFFPVITGLIASHVGVTVLQPMLCGLLAATAISWLLVPQPKGSGNTTLHQE